MAFPRTFAPLRIGKSKMYLPTWVTGQECLFSELCPYFGNSFNDLTKGII